MNNLTIINRNGKLLADSREVAEMVEKQHSHLLRDIKGYKEIIDQNPNLDSANFFTESEYEASTGQKYPCYLLTRKGCDMVANKMTGEKGVLFTAEYVTKFGEMEKQLQYAGLSPELQAIFSLDKKTQYIESRVDKLENNMTIDYGQQLTLQNIAKSMAVQNMGGTESGAYADNKLRGRVFAQIWRDYKAYFNINSYRNTACSQFDKAKEYLQGWKAQGATLREIEQSNQQIGM